MTRKMGALTRMQLSVLWAVTSVAVTTCATFVEASAPNCGRLQDDTDCIAPDDCTNVCVTGTITNHPKLYKVVPYKANDVCVSGDGTNICQPDLSKEQRLCYKRAECMVTGACPNEPDKLQYGSPGNYVDRKTRPGEYSGPC